MTHDDASGSGHSRRTFLKNAGAAAVATTIASRFETIPGAYAAGSDEWMAFVTDSEGNTVGLVSHSPAAG